MNIDIILNPQKYGYGECPHCNGYGSSLKEDARTCSRCGGSGLVQSTPSRAAHTPPPSASDRTPS